MTDNTRETLILGGIEAVLGQDRTPQQQLNDAIFYALREGCFFPVPEPKPGASTRDLIQWGAMRNLHTAIRRFDLEVRKHQP